MHQKKEKEKEESSFLFLVLKSDWRCCSPEGPAPSSSFFLNPSRLLLFLFLFFLDWTPILTPSESHRSSSPLSIGVAVVTQNPTSLSPADSDLSRMPVAMNSQGFQHFVWHRRAFLQILVPTEHFLCTDSISMSVAELKPGLAFSSSVFRPFKA